MGGGFQNERASDTLISGTSEPCAMSEVAPVLSSMKTVLAMR